MTDQPHILIIIPTLNEQDHIAGLLTKLLNDTADLKCEIVIADGGSGDNTASIAKDFADKHSHIHYLHNDKRIQSAAINLAVQKHGEGKEYLIRMDAHSDFPNDYCQTLIHAAQTVECDSVVTPMNTVGTTSFQEGVAAAQNSKLGNGGSLHRSADSAGQYVDHGHHSLMRITAFQAVDGYDESFAHNEDAELDKRLGDAGYKIWLCPKTASTYYPRKDALSLFKQYRNYGYGRCKTLLKHKMKPKIRQMAPVIVLPTLILTVIGLDIAALGFFAWLFLCLGYGAYIGVKAKDANITLYAGIAAAIMHFSWSCGFWLRLFEHFTGFRK